MKQKNVTLLCICLSMALLLFSCKKESSKLPEVRIEKWRTTAIKDSTGNKYYVVNTLANRLEIRVDDKEGKTIFTEICSTIDSTEIPKYYDDLIVFLVAPSKYININQATLSLRMYNGDLKKQNTYVQLLSNIDLKTKTSFTKTYRVNKPTDWAYIDYNQGVVQWYENSLLVREGTEYSLNEVGGMGLGQRGIHIVCYERDFSIRYTKEINASDAYYPIGGGRIIPVNNYEYIFFGINGVIDRLQIVTSLADKWEEKKPVVWRYDLKKDSDVPMGYSVKMIDYYIQENTGIVKYEIYDRQDKLQGEKTKKITLTNGIPL